MDLTIREKVVLVPLVIMIFWIGFYPKPFFKITEPAVRTVIAQVEKGRSMYEANRQADQNQMQDGNNDDATGGGDR